MYLIKLNNKFVVNKTLKLSDEFPNAMIFTDYDAVCDFIEEHDLTSHKGPAEVFTDYGTENEQVEDI